MKINWESNSLTFHSTMHLWWGRLCSQSQHFCHPATGQSSDSMPQSKPLCFHMDQELLSSWSVFGRRPNVASHNVNIYFRVSHFVTHTRTFSYIPIILPILIRYFIPNIFHLFLKFCFGMTRIMVQHTYPKQFLKQKIQKFNWSKATTTWFHDGFWHCKGENGQTQTDKSVCL